MDLKLSLASHAKGREVAKPEEKKGDITIEKVWRRSYMPSSINRERNST